MIRLKRFNEWFGEKLSNILSSMGCFYIVVMLVIVPLFYDHPHDLVGWINYVVQTFFQGASLPLLGYVARLAGLITERMLRETHDNVMSELSEIKQMHQDLHELLKKVN